jgi:heat shock protein HslJ
MPHIPVAVRVLAGLTILVVAACDATGATDGTTPEPTAAIDLAGTSWTLASLGANAPVEGADAWLAFGANGEITGSTGCNNLIGSYAVDGTALSFSTLGTTRMACPGDDLMAQDASVPEALTNVTGWQVDGEGRLHLTGATELVFEPRAA